MTNSNKAYRLTCLWRDCDRAGPYSDHKELFEHINGAHNKAIASGKAGFTCEWAGCGFESGAVHRQGNREKHLITHTQYKPYVCAHRGCASAFNRKDGLNKHVERWHAGREAGNDGESDAESTDTEPTPFECKKCERTFDGAATLKLHNDVVHREAHVRAGKKRTRADSDQGSGNTAAKKKRKTSSAAPVRTSSACSTILDVEDWSDDDAPPSTLVHGDDGDNDEDTTAVKNLMHARLLAVEKRIARLEARFCAGAAD